MNPDQEGRYYRNVVRVVLALMLLCAALAPPATLAQSANPPAAATAPTAPPQTGAATQDAAQRPSTSPNPDLAQMRIDLDRMEGLLGNMSTEIEFLRDQNLQILLRTNAQMWRMLISDLRRQVDREERQPSHR